MQTNLSPICDIIFHEQKRNEPPKALRCWFKSQLSKRKLPDPSTICKTSKHQTDNGNENSVEIGVSVEIGDEGADHITVEN